MLFPLINLNFIRSAKVSSLKFILPWELGRYSNDSLTCLSYVWKKPDDYLVDGVFGRRREQHRWFVQVDHGVKLAALRNGVIKLVELFSAGRRHLPLGRTSLLVPGLPLCSLLVSNVISQFNFSDRAATRKRSRYLHRKCGLSCVSSCAQARARKREEKERRRERGEKEINTVWK